MAEKDIDYQNVFRDITAFAKLGGHSNTKSKGSISWYQDQISQLKKISRFDLLASSKKNQRKRFTPGTMSFYFYSPLYKKTLPYYDTFPLTVFVEPVKSVSGSGFYGLNMHYLPPALRAQLYSKLLEYNTKNKFDLSYSLLKGMSKGVWSHAFKHYLNKQVKSNFLIVPEENMTASIFLPVASFKKASTASVWADVKK